MRRLRSFISFRFIASAPILTLCGFLPSCASSSETDLHDEKNGMRTDVSRSSSAVEILPVMVMVEYDHWAEVVGSDSPTFALYDDGTIIWRKSWNAYLTAKVGKDEIKGLFPVESFKGMEEMYSISNATCQTVTTIYFWVDGARKSVSVYGNLRSQKNREKVPAEFASVFDKLTGWTATSATPWLPEHIEAMVWPYEYSPEEPVKWPDGWPRIDHEMTIKRGDSYSIFIESRHVSSLLSLKKNMGERQAVLIDDNKWAISIRFPFPKEMTWMK